MLKVQKEMKIIYIFALLLVALLHVSFYLKKYVYNIHIYIYIYNILYKGYVPWRKERNSGKKCVEWAF